MSKSNELLMLEEYTESLLKLDFNCELPTFKPKGINKNVFNYSAMLLESIRDQYKVSTISKKTVDYFTALCDEVFFIVTDKKFKIRSVNRMVENYLNMTIEDLWGSDLFKTFPSFNDGNFTDQESYSRNLNVRIESEDNTSTPLFGELLCSMIRSESNELTEILFIFKPNNKNIYKRAKLNSEMSQLDNVIAGISKLKDTDENQQNQTVRLDILKNLIEVKESLKFRSSHKWWANEWKPKLDFINVNEMVSDITGEMQFLKPLQNVILNVSDKTKIPFLVEIEKVKLVLKALILNAIQFQDFTKSSCLIKIVALQEENHLIINVEDNGIGIEREHIERVFEEGYVINVEDERPGGGLGLYFAKNLVISLGGVISVKSVPGQGSTFVLSVPAPIDA